MRLSKKIQQGLISKERFCKLKFKSEGKISRPAVNLPSSGKYRKMEVSSSRKSYVDLEYKKNFSRNTQLSWLICRAFTLIFEKRKITPPNCGIKNFRKFRFLYILHYWEVLEVQYFNPKQIASLLSFSAYKTEV